MIKQEKEPQQFVTTEEFINFTAIKKELTDEFYRLN
jgi:hypothetical protein